MPTSLFRRVTRYRVSPYQNPQENRLTEVTAAVLENVDGFARDLVTQLLRASRRDIERRLHTQAAETTDALTVEAARRRALYEALISMETPRVRIRTQVPTTSKHFVDLEVLLRPPLGTEGDDMLLWVEVKHGAGEHGDQLRAYLADIESSDAVHKAVILLAPRDTMPVINEGRLDVLAVEWQDVSRLVASTRKQQRPAEEVWLMNQYSAYLKEEGLMDPDALTATHALVLLEYDEAAAAVAGICAEADAWIQKEWGERGTFQPTRKGDPRHGLGYWANYSPHPRGGSAAATWRGGWFEWGLRDTAGTEYLDEKRGAWVFIAGATLNASDNPAKAEANQEWLARRRADDFSYFWHSSYYRLCKLRYPDELLNKTSVEAQGQELGRWAVTAFEELAQHPPPG